MVEWEWCRAEQGKKSIVMRQLGVVHVSNGIRSITDIGMSNDGAQCNCAVDFNSHTSRPFIRSHVLRCTTRRVALEMGRWAVNLCGSGRTLNFGVRFGRDLVRVKRFFYGRLNRLANQVACLPIPAHPSPPSQRRGRWHCNTV